MDAKMLTMTEDDMLTLIWALRLLMRSLKDGRAKPYDRTTEESLKQCDELWTYLDDVLYNDDNH